MAHPERVVIAGGGVGGFAVAHELRRRGYAGALALIEPQGMPYDRPPLSKEYLAGTLDAAGLALASASWYAEAGVEVVTDRLAGLRPAAASAGTERPWRAELASGAALEAPVVVLALGGRARRPAVPGGDDPDLLVLRTRADADTLRRALVPGRRLAIVGAGLIGAEVASVASAAGVTVTLVEPDPLPLAGALGPELAGRLHRLHAAHGVRVVAGAVAALERTVGGRRVATAGGESIEADAVLLAVGLEPDVDAAGAAGAEVDGGIVVDAAQRTGLPGLYAVGDGARTRQPDGGLARRHEHYDSAQQAGRRAAATILGEEPPPAQAPWWWTDRYGVHVEAAGDLSAPGTTVVRTVAGEPAAAFRVGAHGRLLGAAAVDGGTLVRAARRLIDRGVAVEPAVLADPAGDLRRLAR